MSITPDNEPETKETEEIDRKLAELASMAKLKAKDKTKLKTIDELLMETQKKCIGFNFPRMPKRPSNV